VYLSQTFTGLISWALAWLLWAWAVCAFPKKLTGLFSYAKWHVCSFDHSRRHRLKNPTFQHDYIRAVSRWASSKLKMIMLTTAWRGRLVRRVFVDSLFQIAFRFSRQYPRCVGGQPVLMKRDINTNNKLRCLNSTKPLMRAKSLKTNSQSLVGYKEEI